jgi:hypothetical protein
MSRIKNALKGPMQSEFVCQTGNSLSFAGFTDFSTFSLVFHRFSDKSDNREQSVHERWCKAIASRILYSWHRR